MESQPQPGEPCCYTAEYRRLFSRRSASRDAAAFRRRGLTRSARDLVDALVSRGVAGSTVLEIGGGVGALQVALLEAGAERAISLDLSPEWDDEADALLEERRLAGRVDRRVGDFVTLADELPPADHVVLHRVVCCYPDWRGLLSAAAGKAEVAVAVTFPRDRWPTRTVVGLENLTRRLRRQEFRAFVHPARAMLELIERSGFRVTADRPGLVWRSVVLHRVG